MSRRRNFLNSNLRACGSGVRATMSPPPTTSLKWLSSKSSSLLTNIPWPVPACGCTTLPGKKTTGYGMKPPSFDGHLAQGTAQLVDEVSSNSAQSLLVPRERNRSLGQAPLYQAACVCQSRLRVLEDQRPVEIKYVLRTRHGGGERLQFFDAVLGNFSFCIEEACNFLPVFIEVFATIPLSRDLLQRRDERLPRKRGQCEESERA